MVYSLVLLYDIVRLYYLKYISFASSSFLTRFLCNSEAQNTFLIMKYIT